MDADGNRKPDAPAGTNQFIKGTRTGHSQETKDRMRAEKAAELLEADMVGEVELQDGRRASAKILMEYGKPKLSAVEQTTVNELEAKTAEELDDMVRALITADPALLQRLGLAPKPALVEQTPVDKVA